MEKRDRIEEEADQKEWKQLKDNKKQKLDDGIQ